jgi:hypothetical protein
MVEDILSPAVGRSAKGLESTSFGSVHGCIQMINHSMRRAYSFWPIHDIIKKYVIISKEIVIEIL